MQGDLKQLFRKFFATSIEQLRVHLAQHVVDSRVRADYKTAWDRLLGQLARPVYANTVSSTEQTVDSRICSRKNAGLTGKSCVLPRANPTFFHEQRAESVSDRSNYIVAVDRSLTDSARCSWKNVESARGRTQDLPVCPAFFREQIGMLKANRPKNHQPSSQRAPPSSR